MKTIIFALALLTINIAYAEQILLVGSEAQYTAEVSMMGNQISKVLLTTPSDMVEVVTPKVLSDSRPWDGCLEVQLTEDVNLNLCTHDGPSSWYLTDSGKYIDLKRSSVVE
jgi:hypothetical protein